MKKNRMPFYLFLLPIYFVLFLYTENIHGLPAINLVRPIVLSIILVGIIFGVLNAIFREASRSGLLTFILWTMFSVYGHLYAVLKAAPSPISILGKHSVLMVLMLVLLTVLIFMVVRTKKSLITLNRSLGIILAALMLFQIFNAAAFYIGYSHQEEPISSANPQTNRIVPINEAAITSKPDIYYIILDTYFRDDAIRKYINLDTTPFVDALRQRGFYVAACSSSNYDFTTVSLTSSLNMNFDQNLDPRFVPDNESNTIMDDYIIHSVVRSTLEEIGYKTYSFATGFSFSEMRDAYQFLSPPEPSLLTPDVRPFEALWFKTTALRALFDIHPPILSNLLNTLSFPYSAHVAREEYLLDTLPQIAEQAGPKFIFAHVIIPHVPLVFRSDGSITSDYHYFNETFDQPSGEEYLIDGYKNQVEYINQRMLPIVDAILKNSAQPPIIIIQGDHGLQYYDPFPILNAYYLPDNGSSELYSSISPVNSFAVIFNHYFGTQIPLLPDNSYISTYTRPYDFTLVKDKPCPLP